MAHSNSEFGKTVSKAASKVAHIRENLPGSAQQTLKDIEHIGSTYLEEARTVIKKNPMAAIAAGLGAGILLGIWMKRK